MTKTVEQVQSAVAERINPDVISGLPATAPSGGGRQLFMPQSFGELMEFAKLMATAHGAVAPHLRGRPSDCLAVAMQSARWGLDPFAVSLKTYFVNDRMAYEAQLVNAVCNTIAPLDGRLHVAWRGEGEALICLVSGKIKGDDREKTVEQEIRTIKTRNSPLWASSPKQQLAYYTTRMWVRLYAPEVLMGVYTPDELADQPHIGPDRARDVTPPRRSDFDAAGAVKTPPAKPVELDQASADMIPLVDEAGEVDAQYPDAEQWGRALIAAATEKNGRGKGYLVNNRDTALELADSGKFKPDTHARLNKIYSDMSTAEIAAHPVLPTDAGNPAGGDGAPSASPAASIPPPLTKDGKVSAAYVKAINEEIGIAPTPELVDTVLAREADNLAKIGGSANAIRMQAARRKKELESEAA